MNNQRIKILFVCESATLAHVSRPFALAESLDSKIFEVIFAVDPRYFSFVFATAPFKVVPINSRSPESFTKILQENAVLFDYQILSDYCKQELDLIARFKPDCIVGDFRRSLSVSGPKTGIPVITLTNSYWSQFAADNTLPSPYCPEALKLAESQDQYHDYIKLQTKEFNKILPFVYNQQVSGINQLREANGLLPFDSYLESCNWGNITFFCDVPGLTELNKVADTEYFIGAANWFYDVKLPAWWDKLSPGYTLISLGSSGMTELNKPLVEAASNFDTQVVLVTNELIDGSKLPPNVFLSSGLPLAEAIKGANIVVSNGGSPVSYAALSLGKPVLAVPFNMDQLLCSRSLVNSEVGVALRADQVTVKTAKDALVKLTNDRKYSLQAQNISQKFSQLAGANLKAVIIEELVSDNGFVANF